MTGTFDIYTRESEDGSSDTADQEAQARAYAARLGLEIHEVVEETVSGGNAIDAPDRELGRLITKIERGESVGIIVRDETRYARDVIESAIGLERIVQADGALLAVWTNFDSRNMTPEQEAQFHTNMAYAQAVRKRNTLRRKYGKYNKAMAGVWCGGAPPVGYDRDEDGRLVPNEDADTVREIFRLRAEGHSFSEIVRLIGLVTATDSRGHKGGGGAERTRRQLTRGGVRHVVANRAYLGEQVVPDPAAARKGSPPKVIQSSHVPLVTPQEFEAANGVPAASPPVRRNLVELYGAELKGLIRCGCCTDAAGRPSLLHVLAPGRYACCRCGRTAITVGKADRAVADEFRRAVENGTAELLAIANDASAYDDALETVERAAAALAEYRDNVELQQLLGLADWTEGLRVRKEAYEQARRGLREVGPVPKRVTDVRRLLRESLHPFLAEALLFPRRGDGPRLTVRWRGAKAATAVAVS